MTRSEAASRSGASAGVDPHPHAPAARAPPATRPSLPLLPLPATTTTRRP